MTFELFGYLGLGLFVLSYSVLFFGNNLKYYFILNFFSCILMGIHSVFIKDIPFLILNAFAGIVLFVQVMRKTTSYICHRKDCDRRIEDK